MKHIFVASIVYNRAKVNNLEYDIVIKEKDEASVKLLIEYGSDYFHSIISDRASMDKKKDTEAIRHNLPFIRVTESSKYDGIEVIGNEIQIGRSNKFESVLIKVCELLIKTTGYVHKLEINVEAVRMDALNDLRGGVKLEDTFYFKCTNKRIVDELNEDKSGFSAKDVKPNSHEYAWWECRDCGHEWRVKVADRYISNTMCPACTNKVVIAGRNDLESQVPKILKGFCTDLNEEKPNEIYYKTGKRYWWRCTNCGHTWPAPVRDRVTRKSGCTSCGHNWGREG